MKKLILFLLLLTSCSLNSNSTYSNENSNSTYEELKYEKDYSFDEYGRILEQYGDRKETPKLN
tara:strand:+ start:52 stop:240 length:189 start_codon:yes stop_codon:yes gene_type:complete